MDHGELMGRSSRWVLAAWMMLQSACAGRHQIIEYDPFGKQKYRARQHPAELSDRSSEQLLAEGYVPIGALTIIRVTSICYETCKLIEHQNGATATLLAAAGKRGGDLVVLQKDDVETTRNVMKQGQCLESYIEDRTVDVYISPVGGAGNRYEPVHRSAEVCTKFQMLHGHETFQQSSGVVWRRE
jgi:hypothetical protein